VARISKDTKVSALKQSPLFEGLSRKQLERIAQLSDDLEVPAGTVLCKEGTTGQEFFVIVEGEADVKRKNRHLGTMRAGEFFGEIALLEAAQRTATVTTQTPVRCFVVTRQAFKSVLDTDPSIERKVLRTLARRVLRLSGDLTAG
jgi:CRP/FNR family transcriptional regulator, cyclic AMP receptor protein